MMEQHKDTLAGSYALNALAESEREELLRQAAVSRSIRAEIAALTETAALLGLSVEPVEPPARLKANVMASIRKTKQLPALDAPQQDPVAQESDARQRVESPVFPPAPVAGRPKTNQKMLALAAGVLLVAAGALTGIAVTQHQQQKQLSEQLSALAQREAQLTELLSAADSRSKTQTLADGARISLSYSVDEGLMAVSTTGLPQLPADKAYELWLISDAGAVSAGMINGVNSDGTTMVAGAMTGVTHFGITVEPATGSPSPTTDPIVLQGL